MRHDEFLERNPAAQLRCGVQRLRHPRFLQPPSWHSDACLEEFPSAIFCGLAEVVKYFGTIEKLPEQVRIR